MNEEIKDLIEQLNVCSVNDYNFEIYGDDAKILNKYITNLQNRIDKAIKYIKHYETIRGYYEYEECGYDEYNYEEDLKEELLDILKESGE